ncbi:hypothetical protein MLD38_007236 [Melastoma candidum]|uniref:Uncharacterized protein n=1 Tax=Melastoma candidum TaxID=119954 RepID=A0ACB9RRU1_9MYRT|nr:hypothetical protein MLD38_007236 [Melastoma candidum]
MGCCHSFPFLSSTHPNSTPCFKAIVRVVHLDGHVQHFPYPVTVAHLIGEAPRHVVCTPLQLLSSGFVPMKGDTLLQRGHVYFLLPYSALQADASPLDLSSLARKLLAKAKGPPPDRKKPQNVGGGQERWVGGGRSWKPLLETIREKSFNRRSESDLQEDRVPVPVNVSESGEDV